MFHLEGKKIGVLPSAGHDTLFLGNLNKGWSVDDFSNVVCQVSPDVSTDLAQPSGSETISKKFKNRGFGFVKFSSHAWAEEDAGVDTQELAKIKIALIINLPSTADENYLKLLFGPFGKVGCVQGWSHTVSVKTKPFCQFVQIYPIEQWIDCSSFEIDAHIRGWLYPRLRFGSYIKRAEESSIAGLKRGFDALNSYLASHTFLVGDGVTLVEEEEAPKPKLKFLGGSFTCDAYYTAASTRYQALHLLYTTSYIIGHAISITSIQQMFMICVTCCCCLMTIFI
ncbi:putative nucleotide-binding alpha-beta plait domain superfamily, RNA-binding domain superfamily [Helianthus debilis subsp. tardiflorus]